MTVHAPAPVVAEHINPAVGTVEPVDDRTCVLHTGADWLGGLAVYVADIGVDFTVLEPPELVDMVGELADRFTRATAAERR